MIYLIDNIKKTMHNLFTVTTNIEGGVLWKKSSKTLETSFIFYQSHRL